MLDEVNDLIQKTNNAPEINSKKIKKKLIDYNEDEEQEEEEE